MDAARFDDLSRSFTSGSPRRRLFAGLAGGLLAALPLALASDDAAAKKKRKKKKKKKKAAPPPPPPPPPPCVPNCAGKNCGDNSCGGSCGGCTGGTCTDGFCVCPVLQELCGGACLAPCEGNTTRNPGTCDCCAENGHECGPGFSPPCCSLMCGPGPMSVCVGRPADEVCTFDAQCASGDCDGTNHCT